MKKLLSAMLAAMAVMGFVTTDAAAKARTINHFPQITLPLACKVLAVEFVDGTLIIDGTGLMTGSKIPEVSFGGTPVDVLSDPAPSATNIVVDVASVVEGLVAPKDFLLEIKRYSKDAGCPSHLVSVVPPKHKNVVFVTSEVFKGDLTGSGDAAVACNAADAGLNRADCICDYLGRHANPPLTGHFIAWISVSDGLHDAITRLADANADGPWYNLGPGGGELVSESRAGLLDCDAQGNVDCLRAPIAFDENRVDRSKESTDVWTGTSVESAITDTCRGWITQDSVPVGLAGSPGATDFNWTSEKSVPCSTPSRLYCFEIPNEAVPL